MRDEDVARLSPLGVVPENLSQKGINVEIEARRIEMTRGMIEDLIVSGEQMREMAQGKGDPRHGLCQEIQLF